MFAEPEPEVGERFAIGVAAAVATWWFPMVLLAGITGWLVVNITARPLEPYPMIVIAGLAAVLSTIAALQGPLILLTQRRAAMRDRARDRETYRVAANTEADLHQVKQRLDELIEQLDALSARVDSGG
jgi:uncharacterized membrane protein